LVKNNLVKVVKSNEGLFIQLVNWIKVYFF
jgi:hypothetical protein